MYSNYSQGIEGRGEGDGVLIPFPLLFKIIPHPQLLSSLNRLPFPFQFATLAKILSNPTSQVAVKSRIPPRNFSLFLIPHGILVKSRNPRDTLCKVSGYRTPRDLETSLILCSSMSFFTPLLCFFTFFHSFSWLHL